jgi:hypothetical protein
LIIDLSVLTLRKIKGSTNFFKVVDLARSLSFWVVP